MVIKSRKRNGNISKKSNKIVGGGIKNWWKSRKNKSHAPKEIYRARNTVLPSTKLILPQLRRNTRAAQKHETAKGNLEQIAYNYASPTTTTTSQQVKNAKARVRETGNPLIGRGFRPTISEPLEGHKIDNPATNKTKWIALFGNKRQKEKEAQSALEDARNKARTAMMLFNARKP
jgi:hypothetical protein